MPEEVTAYTRPLLERTRNRSYQVFGTASSVVEKSMGGLLDAIFSEPIRDGGSVTDCSFQGIALPVTRSGGHGQRDCTTPPVKPFMFFRPGIRTTDWCVPRVMPGNRTRLYINGSREIQSRARPVSAITSYSPQTACSGRVCIRPQNCRRHSPWAHPSDGDDQTPTPKENSRA
jgi:hypothetical protein